MPPWYRRRNAVIAVCVYATLAAVIVGPSILVSGWNGLLNAAVLALLSVLTRPLWARWSLTLGHYTLTSRRIVVERRINGVRVRRSELLTDLTTPKLLGDGSIAFGDPREQENPGHRASGLLVPPLVLHKVPDAEHVLGLIRQAQRDARG